MVGDSVAFLAGEGLRVFFDAEHFFDGYKANPEFALRVLEAAAEHGADCLVLCDTNGGSLPHEVAADHRARSRPLRRRRAGRHPHPERHRLRVANTVAAVLGGATQVQGTINGYGERTGNANLMTVIPDLTLKMGVATLPEGRLERLTVGQPPRGRAGEPAAAPRRPLRRARRPSPTRAGCTPPRSAGRAAPPTSTSTRRVVGNHTRVLVSDLGGRAGMAMKAKEFGVELDDRAAAALTDDLKRLEREGCVFEAADASLELLMRRATGWEQTFFQVEAYRVSSYHREGPVMPDGDVEVVTRGDGQDLGRRASGSPPSGRATVRSTRSTPPCARALNGRYPALERIHLTDFKVRVLDGGAATGAVVRVLIDSTDGERAWTTIGVSTQRHRGVLAGADRLPRLRPAPRRRLSGRRRPLA